MYVWEKCKLKKRKEGEASRYDVMKVETSSKYNDTDV